MLMSKRDEEQVQGVFCLEDIKQQPSKDSLSTDVERRDSEHSFGSGSNRNKKTAIWTSQRLGGNESEEELTSKDRSTAQDGILKITSFEVVEHYV